MRLTDVPGFTVTFEGDKETVTGLNGSSRGGKAAISALAFFKVYAVAALMLPKL